MGRQAKGRKHDGRIGNGKVTPVQVAFIVDRYLADNNFPQSRSIFRSEASSLVANSSIHEAPKGLLTLGAMLDEYVQLKEQKVILDQEKCRLEQEKLRVQTLLKGMQDAMNIYNNSGGGGGGGCSLPPSQPMPLVSPSNTIMSPVGYPPNKTPIMTSTPMNGKLNGQPANTLTPAATCAPRKRKDYKIFTDTAQSTKRHCNPRPSSHSSDRGPEVVLRSSNVVDVQGNVQQSSALESSPNSHVGDGLLAQKMSVAKSLFGRYSESPKDHTSCPSTPTQAASTQSDESISPGEDISSSEKSNHNTSPQENTPTTCTIISSKTIIVSPCKQNPCISIERNRCTLTSPMKANMKKQSSRDNVKGRLDFDGSDQRTSENASADGNTTTGSDDMDLFDLDHLSNLDAFDTNFSLSELLSDFDLDYGEIDPFVITVDASTAAAPSSTLQMQRRIVCESITDEIGACQEHPEHTCSAADALTGIAYNTQCTESIAAVRSITRRVQLRSPAAKTPRKSNGEER